MNRFEQQVLATMPRLRRYARALARNAADADDMVQDCVERALKHRTSWRGDNLQGWLMTILTNVNRNRARGLGRRPDTVTMEDAGEPEAPAVDNDPLERDRLAAALNRLDADQRAVLMLVVVEGYRYAEVSAMLDIPIGTVMSRLSRARKHLASTLEAGNVVELRRNR